jgi:GT2 family glycosyltransferase/glycosyltransferase involved in cell wall biosynthesis
VENSIENNQSQNISTVTFFTNYGEDPCAHLRLRGPMQHLGLAVIDGKVGNDVQPEKASFGDVIVLQRDFPRDLPSYRRILDISQKEKKPVIYDIDDLLLVMPETHPERKSQHLIESLLPMLQALHEADLVTTTTEVLKNELLHFNKNVKVLPNFFNDSLWQLREPQIETGKTKPLIIGYMGSESHLPDLELITPVLERLLNQYQNGLSLHFWGIKPPLKIANYPQIKWFPAVTYEYVDFSRYFQTQSADIFIAPLQNNRFNQAKSPLKFFEYSALGSPGVYSKLETYEQVVTHGQNGFLATSEEEWHAHLIQLIENSELRYQLAKNAQQTIRENWLLSNNAHIWHNAYEKIISNLPLQEISDKPSLDLVKSLNHQYYELTESLKSSIDEKDKTIREKEKSIHSLISELSMIKTSRAWKIVLIIRKMRDIIAPSGTFRENLVNSFLQFINGQKARRLQKKRKARLESLINTSSWLENCGHITKHDSDIDIIVCVHNALEDVRLCLESITTNSQQPYNLILIDDGSDAPTKNYLQQFSINQKQSKLIRNENALGYTRAANLGMRASEAPFIVLLNSDTIVTPNWIDRLHRTITRDEKHGIAGPLSNTASWQSIPKIDENGDWAKNKLPEDITVEKMGKLVAKYSACIHPQVPLLNGFCIMIRSAVINDIGYFDEDNFGQGYGEEDDFVIRANKAGWHSVIVDDAYIFHAQSKSYTNEGRFALQAQSGEKLRNKHGMDVITNKVEFMHPNRVMEGIRARTRIMLDREMSIKKGKEEFANKKILFLLPVVDAGGGANVILDEAKCMLDMDVEVSIFNLPENKSGFLKNYAHVGVPFIFGTVQDLPKLCDSFDAVVASANYSVPWLKPLKGLSSKLILGYYVQGFEALMYKEGSEEYNQAVASYTMIDGIKRFTKTQWTRNEVLKHTGADSDVVGISVNYDLFRPRDMLLMGVKPVTIVAMIRPGSHYRNPEMTLAILKNIEEKYGKDVDIWLFGSDDVHNVVEKKYLAFNWRQLGKLTQVQVASMMSKADIFTDFSSHQAMGLSALEAMAAGCSVIVPKNGGAVEFINHKVNGIVADTSMTQASQLALEELIEDDGLRQQLQINGTKDVVKYYPERVSYNILSTLFSR